MAPNGQFVHAEDETRNWALLSGVGSVETAMPTLIMAANALRQASQALGSIATDIAKIRSDTARAISDTVAIKRTLADITEREQQVRRELADVRSVQQLKMPKQRRAHKKRK